VQLPKELFAQVERALDDGHPLSHIRKVLIDSGYNAKQVDALLARARHRAVGSAPVGATKAPVGAGTLTTRHPFATKGTAIGIVILTLLYGVFFTGRGPSATPQAPQNASCNSYDAHVSVPSAPHGIFVFGGEGAGVWTQVNRYVIDNPDICGLSLSISWSEVDAGPGKSPRYNWTSVDNALAPWEAAGKVVNLIVIGASEVLGTSAQRAGFADSATPLYVQRHVTMVRCGTYPPVPVFWQPAYESNFKAFVAATISHFRSDRHIGYIRLGLGNGGEDIIYGPNKPACISEWNAAGYGRDWPAYNLQMLKFFNSLHSPDQLDIGLNIFEDTPPIATVAAEAASLGIGFGVEGLIGQNASEIQGNIPCIDFDWCRLFYDYAGMVPLRVQTLQASTPAGGESIVGPLPPLLKAALKIHAQIFEIYPQDALVAFDPNFPGYARFSQSYARAIASADATLGTTDGEAPTQ
jgi:hypothetical protein